MQVYNISFDGPRLEGEVAVITGAASGIWESTAKLFFKHGAKGVLADILDDVGHSLSRHLCSSSSSFVHCNVTKEKDIENAVNTAISKYGKLDIMLNNADISRTLKFNILENELSDFQKVLNVNLLGVFLGTKHAAKAMIPARQVPSQMTRDLFKLEDGDEFSNVYSHFKCGDILWPEDIAEAALYLASDASRFVSGHNLIVDGGFTAANQDNNKVEKERRRTTRAAMGVSLLPAAARWLEGEVAVITGAASGIWESTAKLFFKHGAKGVLADILDDVGHSLSRHLCSSSSSFVHCNVTKEKDIEKMRLTQLFPNFQKVLNVNLLGVFLGTKHAAKAMIPARQVPSQMTRDLFKLEDGDEFSNVYSHFKCGDILWPEDIAEAALYLASDASRFVSGHNLIVDGGFTAANQGLYSYQ
ncbi:hypothetical protein SDJN03_19635, partial [Cucurbita argyrosperma subsp. sororia]